MADNHNPYDATATPDFDDWGWDDYWSMNDWLIWHNALIKAYGQPMGNDLWVQGWLQGNTWSALFGDVRGDWLTFNTDFKNHLKSYKTSGGVSMYSAIIDPVGYIMGGAVDVAADVGESVSNAGEAIKNTTKTISWLVPIAAIAAVVLAALLISKVNPNSILK